jgi:hypothetical protein
MNWFRWNAGACTRVALFALAFQMAVSFGHMHADDLGLAPSSAADQSRSTSAQTPAAPAKQDDSSTLGDYCPICASMALLATGIPVLPPFLTVPVPIARIWASPTPNLWPKPANLALFSGSGSASRLAPMVNSPLR